MPVSLFTPENRAAVIARLEVGLSIPEAAEGSGLKKPTVQGWIARGKRETDTDYSEFAGAVTEVMGAPKLEAMTPEEHRAKVSEVARKGNVQALKLYWEMILADRNPDEAEEENADPLSEVDELAARRAG